MNNLLITLVSYGALTLALFGYKYNRSKDFKSSAAGSIPLGVGLMFAAIVLYFLGV